MRRGKVSRDKTESRAEGQVTRQGTAGHSSLKEGETPAVSREIGEEECNEIALPSRESSPQAKKRRPARARRSRRWKLGRDAWRHILFSRCGVWREKNSRPETTAVRRVVSKSVFLLGFTVGRLF